MKKILFFIFICLSVLSFGQNKLSFVDYSKIIYRAEGHCYNTELKEWIHFENAVNDDVRYKRELMRAQGFGMMSKIYQNFETIQTRSVIHNNIKYYVLLIDKWNGHYNYQYVKQNWILDRVMYGFIFTESDYIKLKDNDSLIKLKTNRVFTVDYPYNNISILDKIEKNLKEPLFYYKDIYVFSVKKEKNNSVKFLIPYIDNEKNREFYNLDLKYFQVNQKLFEDILVKIPYPHY